VKVFSFLISLLFLALVSGCAPEDSSAPVDLVGSAKAQPPPVEQMIAAETTSKESEQSSPFSELQSRRLRLINSLIRDGIFSRINTAGELPYLQVTAWVNGQFSSLDYQMKSKFCEIVWAYYFENPDPNHKYIYSETLTLKDNFSGKTVGSYSPFNVFHPGLSMK
jgi:hypothetical protein